MSEQFTNIGQAATSSVTDPTTSDPGQMDKLHNDLLKLNDVIRSAGSRAKDTADKLYGQVECRAAQEIMADHSPGSIGRLEATCDAMDSAIRELLTEIERLEQL